MKVRKLSIGSHSARENVLTETVTTEIKQRLLTDKHEFETRHEPKLLALLGIFTVSGFCCEEQNQRFSMENCSMCRRSLIET